MSPKEKAVIADRIWSNIDTILTVADQRGTTAWLKTVAIYFSADELAIIKEAVNEASSRWYDEARSALTATTRE